MHLSTSKDPDAIELSTRWRIKKSALLAAPQGLAMTVKPVGEAKQVQAQIFDPLEMMTSSFIS